MPLKWMQVVFGLGLWSSAFSAQSTMQIPEGLLVEGKMEAIFELPIHPLYTEVQLRKKLAEIPGYLCSANWRGYVGRWEIRDNQLYLVSLIKDGCARNAPLVPAQLLFDEQKYPVKAHWYSGTLSVMPTLTIEMMTQEIAPVRIYHVEQGRVTKITEGQSAP
ncbi:hypothetical protein [Vibrio stylophorae]|nr:hypothetical protein [Vibrio stylophorae]